MKAKANYTMGRPVPTFHDFVGHKQIVELLKRQLHGAKVRGEPCPHSNFIGPSGVGKTKLARALATEYGTEVITALGYDSAVDLMRKLKCLKACDFFFIDEAQNLSPKIQEMLFQVIDENRLPNWEEGPDSPPPDNAGSSEIPPCTIILATNQPGKLLDAMQKRMELSIRLAYYSIREMKEIVDRLATDLSLLISPQASGQIAKISGGLPRIAKHHLSNLRRHFADSEHRQVGVDEVRQYCVDFGIDAKGLGKIERDYLLHLAENESASVDSLALRLGVDVDYIRFQVESKLQRLGLFCIGHGGRRLTPTGQAWVRKTTSKGE